MRRKLLVEITQEIREGLPEGCSIHQFIGNADRLQDMAAHVSAAIDPVSLAYHWGQLLGAAQWEGVSVEELLSAHGIIVWKDEGPSGPCDCPGWMHFNVGEDREGIQRCDECNKFESDEDAAREHSKHCRCGASAEPMPVGWIKICHACRNDVPICAVIDNNRAFCSLKCSLESDPATAPWESP